MTVVWEHGGEPVDDERTRELRRPHPHFGVGSPLYVLTGEQCREIPEGWACACAAGKPGWTPEQGPHASWCYLSARIPDAIREEAADLEARVAAEEARQKEPESLRESFERHAREGTLRPGPLEIPDEWTFRSTAVAAGFDQHVREQLPWYGLVTDAIVTIGRHYVGEGGKVLDVGASTGNVGRALAPVLDERHAELLSVEESEEMAERWDGPGRLVVQPIQTVDFPADHFDLIVANLVLMFLRADEQALTLERLQRGIKPGGALLVVERMLPAPGYLSVVYSRLTLEAKLRAGASPDEIIRKELALGGVQRPLDPRVLLAHGAVEWFRFGDFAGWILEKTLPRH